MTPWHSPGHGGPEKAGGESNEVPPSPGALQQDAYLGSQRKVKRLQKQENDIVLGSITWKHSYLTSPLSSHPQIKTKGQQSSLEPRQEGGARQRKRENMRINSRQTDVPAATPLGHHSFPTKNVTNWLCKIMQWYERGRVWEKPHYLGIEKSQREKEREKRNKVIT